LQTILGAGGAIGKELAKVLPEYTNKIRLVSRKPKFVNGNEELVSANLFDKNEMFSAVEGSDVVYLTVGLDYNHKIWAEYWPIIMRNAIEACKTTESKIVFFDNIYMYDPNYLNEMTEDTPQNPVSKKGKVRKEIADMLMAEIKKGNLIGLIARSADFYGPSILNSSVLNETIVKNLANGKKANWLGDVTKKHSFTYTPDAGRATAILGNSEKAFNQVWHLPTAKNPPTVKEWIKLFAQELGVEPNYREVSKSMTKIAGLFIPIMKELAEMYYQNDRDYVFNSDKFEKNFDFKSTLYEMGIKEVVQKDFNRE
jgi:nucleoside-diphosphate-sugar epimerase